LYLWELCKQFDLRFIVIHDRYDPEYNRTLEELKHRYYSIARRILEDRKIYNHPIIKSGYNYEQEMKRRACLERIISRTKEESQQEFELLKQAAELEKKAEKYERIENDLKNLSQNNKHIQNFEEYIQDHARETDSFVYLRSLKLKHPLPIAEKVQKKVEILLRELNIPEKLTPTARIEQSYDSLRNSLIILSSLKKHCDKKQREKEKLTQTLQELQSNKPMRSSTITIPTNNISQDDIQSISSSGFGTKNKSISQNPKTNRKVILILNF
jgi:DNA methyltransferase 1-associated protein 1